MAARVVTFHYTLKDKEGKVLDSSQGHDPMTYLEGSGQIIPGLENALKTAKTGDKQNVAVKAAEAYGEHDTSLVFEVPRSQFPPGEQIDVGMKFRAGAPDEPSPVFTVTHASDSHVKVDGNHPLAGQDLFFDVEVTDVRDATLEEIKHGHAHGPGGHHHH
ncbi:MAG: peptidylprolyl isomerase [Deltaproteobacteria bacterium]|nr:peptidylprolyl isomerase [Deltaproteobacteria bacterium]